MLASFTTAALWRVVPLLGITQIIGWGSLYYSIAVLAQDMASDLDVSQAVIFGAFSAGLIASGLVAPAVGRTIDAHGGRLVMTWGSVLACIAMACIGLAHLPIVFVMGWILAGMAMSATLYDAAFPALRQIAGGHYRGALTMLTLFGGLASTVFWPLSLSLQQHYGWRGAILIFAVLNLVVCGGLHWCLPKPTPSATKVRHAHLPSKAPPSGFLLLSSAFAANAFVFSAIGAHIVAALSSGERTITDAVLIAALIGPMQVAGRLLEFAFGRQWAATRIGMASFAAVALGMLLLAIAGTFPWVALVFAVVYGTANGVMTIARGAIPAELYPSHGYGEVLGKLARPSFFAKAIAPLTLALWIDAGLSYAMAALALTLLSLTALVMLLLALRCHRHISLH